MESGTSLGYALRPIEGTLANRVDYDKTPHGVRSGSTLSAFITETSLKYDFNNNKKK